MGVTIGVGNAVGVAVGGNQMTVGVGVSEAAGSVGVALGSRLAVGAAVQALQANTNRQVNNRFFIAGIVLIIMIIAKFG